MLKRLIVLGAMMLAGCGSSDAPTGTPRASRQQRAAASEAVLSQTPVPRTYRIDGNELKVIEVPVKDASNFADMQRCFVWRDAEFKTATLSCGQQPDVLISN